MRSAFALRIISGKNIFICKSGKSADFPDLLFHGRGRSGKRHLQRRFLRKRGAAGNSPSVIACGDATFPKGTASAAAIKFPAQLKGVPLGELAANAVSRLRGWLQR